MKNKLHPLLGLISLLTVLNATAQPGGGGGPNFGGSMSKLFGDNKNFSASLELMAKDGRAGDTTIPGVLSYDEGKSRFEMDMGQMKNSNMPPGAAEQMKAMGMDKMIVIARPDQQKNCMIYPGLAAFAEMPDTNSASPEALKKFTLTKTEVGKETIAGQACSKNQVTVTDDKGKKTDSVVWFAAGLKDFPMRIEMEERGTKLTLNFSNVKLQKPDAKLFEPPTDLKKYDNVQALMQTEMMKKMGGGGGFPPPQR
jgi:hypothetical protein